MRTYIREFESTEARITVLNRLQEYRILISYYNKDFTTQSAVEKIAILPKDVTTRDLIKYIEEKLLITNLYDLNDWRVA